MVGKWEDDEMLKNKRVDMSSKIIQDHYMERKKDKNKNKKTPQENKAKSQIVKVKAKLMWEHNLLRTHT